MLKILIPYVSIYKKLLGGLHIKLIFYTVKNYQLKKGWRIYMNILLREDDRLSEQKNVSEMYFEVDKKGRFDFKFYDSIENEDYEVNIGEVDKTKVDTDELTKKCMDKLVERLNAGMNVIDPMDIGCSVYEDISKQDRLSLWKEWDVKIV